MMEKNQSTLDDLDFAILSCLQQDGRMSFTEIAERLTVSVGTARTRLNRLIDEGIISIVGRVNPDKVGFRAYAHIAVYVRPATLKEQVAQEISAKLKSVFWPVLRASMTWKSMLCAPATTTWLILSIKFQRLTAFIRPKRRFILKSINMPSLT